MLSFINFIKLLESNQIYKPINKEFIKNNIEKAKNRERLINLIKSKTITELVNYDFDKYILGVSSDELVSIPITELSIKWLGDMENVKGFDMKKYFHNIPLNELPPIEVSFSKGKFYIEDGHHRYGYAKQLKQKEIQAILEIKDNPFDYLGLYIDDIIKIKKEL